MAAKSIRDAISQLVFTESQEPRLEMGFGIYRTERGETVINKPATGDEHTMLGSNIYEDGRLVYQPGEGFFEPEYSQIMFHVHTHPCVNIDLELYKRRLQILEYPSYPDIRHFFCHIEINHRIADGLFVNPVMIIVCNRTKRIFQLQWQYTLRRTTEESFEISLIEAAIEIYRRRFPHSTTPPRQLNPFDYFYEDETGMHYELRFPNFLRNRSSFQELYNKLGIKIRTSSFEEFLCPHNDSALFMPEFIEMPEGEDPDDEDLEEIPLDNDFEDSDDELDESDDDYTPLRLTASQRISANY